MKYLINTIAENVVNRRSDAIRIGIKMLDFSITFGSSIKLAALCLTFELIRIFDTDCVDRLLLLLLKLE